MQTPTRRLALAAALLALSPACFREVGECVGTAVGTALGRVLGVSLAESLAPLDRPDEVRPGATPLYLSGAHQGGRLVVTFDGPPVSGTLPRRLGDGGCESVGDFAYLVGADGGALETLSATLTVTQLPRTDAGLPTVFDLTGLSALLSDGGQRPVSSRTLTVLFP